MEKITFVTEDGESVEFFVVEQTRISGVNYLLVADQEEGDGNALILKDTSGEEDAESIYTIVSDDEELNAVADIFTSLLDEIELEQ
ncbi:MAG: DUF1292 domain-containing protein [Lachnospiraceae bacterium]|nr:DUF1292 domain-containing protein [Lachnospiraceae bacterium]MDD3660977.1 DUF1292 domain-containing protein [Lachnospiraceae bacterium]